MLIELSPDQEILRDTTARYLDREVPPEVLRQLRDDADGYRPGYWSAGAELGWTALLVDDELGGGSVSGAPLVDLSLIAYEFGLHAAPGPLIGTNLVAAALSTAITAGGADPSLTEALDALLAGEATGAWALAEPPPHDAYGTVTLTVRADGDDVVLDGVKRPVEGAALAGYLLVTGRTGDGLTQVLVPTDAAGLTIAPMQTVELTRRYSLVTFAGVRLPRAAVVGELGGADEAVRRQLQLALVILAAESVGTMQKAFDMTVAWAFDRYSFGRPLASYQEIKHRFADMKLWLEASHAAADAAAAAVDAGLPEADELVSVAKALTGKYGSELIQDCIQIHGGIGVTFEHDLHLYLRRHTVNRSLFGLPEEHQRRITDFVVAQASAQAAQLRAAELEPAEVSAPAGPVAVERPAGAELEDVESFRERARAWIRSNLKPDHRFRSLRILKTDEEELAEVARSREVQRMFFDAGFAGITFPREYGGAGLTDAHQEAWNIEIAGFEYPRVLQVPTLVPCAATILEFGTHEQKLRHLPAILRGDEIWIQFLSEPSGGSDVAGALMSAVREGDEWLLNGSKVWSTGAWWSDWALCLARTNWDVPKHRGLSVFMLPVHQDGLEINRIEMLNGSREFCQEFLTDVRVPDSERLGEVDGGWTVGTRWMMHERMAGNSPLATHPRRSQRSGETFAVPLVAIAEGVGKLDDPRVRELIGEMRMLAVTMERLGQRLGAGMASGRMHPQSSAIGRLISGIAGVRRDTIAYEIAGATAAAWTDEDGAAGGKGLDFLIRQVSELGGGTTEIARNVISERVLGMPREAAPDHGVAFRDVPRGARSR
ncbi:acyl-CoA dehydrogenase [Frankia sp. AgB1.9]|uniref:acyl-CoA dehydrogenase n=1 Tax=unclassified Frankia TaxID=2632575 RepID=UPI001931C672|nr:acyl-CoA dehydrogenase [Frankia sp. AgW1.1]MBL7548979.1 acyl-CoA dehydrogenase [Frankia sp. AgB1.9]MBL7622571.1 acyl-CoA dehydrogenase [Frankia sp. AgB1.8]